MTEGKKIRYAIGGVGSISHEAMMLGVEHTGNSTIAALVTGDPEKAATLAEAYEVAYTCGYEEYGELLGQDRRGLPGHPELATYRICRTCVRGWIHVLLEKPMEVSSEQCEAILRAQERSTAKLMVAYRLHFEPATIAAIEKVRSGELGEVHLFTSTFAQMVDPSNHRAKSGVEAGPIFDMGPYPINGVRNLFESEPTEAFATGTRHPEAGFGDLDDTVSVTLRFPGGRLAQFTLSYYGNQVDTYTVVGTKGLLEVNPGYMYGNPLEHSAQYGKEKKHESFKNTDHFGGEMKYFSECILNGTDPEPDGYKGLADVWVIEAIVRSLGSGKFEQVEAVTITRRISPDQEQTLRAVKRPRWSMLRRRRGSRRKRRRTDSFEAGVTAAAAWLQATRYAGQDAHAEGAHGWHAPLHLQRPCRRASGYPVRR